MVSLTEVRTHNTTLKSLPAGLVAVFVGGTSGIGLYTAREFVRNTNAPHVYLVGRNQAEATRISDELRQINNSSRIDFIKGDVSLLRNVDRVCKEIKEKEQKVNLLFMTIGYLTLKGRDETEEGLDRKFSLHYYARMRFAQNLAPLLTAAGNDPDPKANLSRVFSVLDPYTSRATAPNFDDLSLKNNFSIKNCALHASSMNNWTFEHLAKAYPQTSFIHANPSGVNTGAARGVGGISGTISSTVFKALAVLAKPWMVDPKESGERHLFAATAPRFSPRARAEGVQGAVEAADGVKGGGIYHLNWDGESAGNDKKLADIRSNGAEHKIWSHTQDVFTRICDEGERY